MLALFDLWEMVGQEATMTARNHLRQIVETRGRATHVAKHSIDDDESFALLCFEDPNPEEARDRAIAQSLIRARRFEADGLAAAMDRRRCCKHDDSAATRRPRFAPRNGGHAPGCARLNAAR